MEQQVVIPPKKSSVLGTDLGFSLQAKLATRNSPNLSDDHRSSTKLVVGLFKP